MFNTYEYDIIAVATLRCAERRAVKAKQTDIVFQQPVSNNAMIQWTAVNKESQVEKFNNASRATSS